MTNLFIVFIHYSCAFVLCLRRLASLVRLFVLGMSKIQSRERREDVASFMRLLAVHQSVAGLFAASSKVWFYSQSSNVILKTKTTQVKGERAQHAACTRV
jgi:hypothetical protein